MLVSIVFFKFIFIVVIVEYHGRRLDKVYKVYKMCLKSIKLTCSICFDY